MFFIQPIIISNFKKLLVSIFTKIPKKLYYAQNVLNIILIFFIFFNFIEIGCKEILNEETSLGGRKSLNLEENWIDIKELISVGSLKYYGWFFFFNTKTGNKFFLISLVE